MKKNLFVFLAIAISAANSSAQPITGITNAGGGLGYGATYSYDPNTGKDSLLFSFAGRGSNIMLGTPRGNVIQATNGLLYGMTPGGGNYNYGGIFSYDPVTGKDSIYLNFNFTNGATPYGSLIQATNGLLYGMATSGGIGDEGLLFSFDPVTSQYTILKQFYNYYGGSPEGSLFQASDGLLYIMPASGPIYTYDPGTGNFFPYFNNVGFQSSGSFIQASNGLLYGLASQGGTNFYGTLFSFDPVAHTDSVYVNFNVTNGAMPQGSLMQASNGLLYGMASEGGSVGFGVMFSFNPVNGQYTILFNFTGPNGAYPYGSLIQASNGLLYGTTWEGGTTGKGVIFAYNTVTGLDSVVVNLSGLKNGDSPYGDLFQASNGYLYSMNSQGGSAGAGTLSRLDAVTGKDSVMLNFDINQYRTQFNATPIQNSPMQDTNGMIYGMTSGGGTNDYGTLFKYNPLTGKDTILINFDMINGGYPNGTLLQASDGLLYGTTSAAMGWGNLFSYNPVTGKDSVRFYFDSAHGANPMASLLQASDGLLYGTTMFGGGTFFAGTLFSYNLFTGKDTVLHYFDVTTGFFPASTLTEGANKVLYGTTTNGPRGPLIFSYDINTATLDTMVTLAGQPQGNLIIDTALHIIYGAYISGGDSGYGVLYSFNMTTMALNTLSTFRGPNGSFPTCLLMYDTASKCIYSTTYQGGSNNYGVLFKYNTLTNQETVLYSFQDSAAFGHRRLHAARHPSVGVNPCGIMLPNNSRATKVVNVSAKKETISVYPNPVSSMATVVFGSAGKHYLILNDITGRRIRTTECIGKQTQLNCEGLAPGVYFVNTYDEKHTYIATSKIIVE